MIQRKQSLFLIAVFLLAIVMLFIPFQYITDEKMSWGISLLPILNFGYSNSNVIAPLCLNLLVMVISVVTIFLFKNRNLQYKLSNIVALLNVFIVGLFFLLPFVNAQNTGTLSFSFGAFLPILNIGFSFLASHFIKKDEQLVRNSDRIR